MTKRQGKTQIQLYTEACRNNAGRDAMFLELLQGNHPITKAELKHNIAKRPEIWARYAGWLERLN